VAAMLAELLPQENVAHQQSGSCLAGSRAMFNYRSGKLYFKQSGGKQWNVWLNLM